MIQSFEYGWNNRGIFVSMPLPNDLEYPYYWPSFGLMDDFGNIYLHDDPFEYGWDSVCAWLGEDAADFAPQGH